MSNIHTLEFKKCCACGERATETIEMQEFTEIGPVRGTELKKYYCASHLPKPLDEDGLRFLVDERDREIERLRAILRQCMPGANPIDLGSGEIFCLYQQQGDSGAS